MGIRATAIARLPFLKQNPYPQNKTQSIKNILWPAESTHKKKQQKQQQFANWQRREPREPRLLVIVISIVSIGLLAHTPPHPRDPRDPRTANRRRPVCLLCVPDLARQSTAIECNTSSSICKNKFYFAKNHILLVRAIVS